MVSVSGAMIAPPAPWIARAATSTAAGRLEADPFPFRPHCSILVQFGANSFRTGRGEEHLKRLAVPVIAAVALLATGAGPLHADVPTDRYFSGCTAWIVPADA